MTAILRRGFADVVHGQMHYRTAGAGMPLLMVHGSPGSAKQIVGLIGDMAAHALVIAPDTCGNGDSTPLPLETPEITDLAAALPGFLDALGLERVDVYGSHTGAAIAAELAILAPDRVRSLVLDGLDILTDAERAAVLARYAFPFPADLEGAYLQRVFMFCRDQYVFFPWYERNAKGLREGAALPDAQVLHDWVVEVLKAHTSYHLNYRAAFRWRAQDRLPLVRHPALVYAAANDPLVASTQVAAQAVSGGRYVALPRSDAAGYADARRTLIVDFLAAQAAAPP